MMKILKYGDLYAAIQLTCPKCKSLLKVNTFDAKYGFSDTRYVICPCCNELIKLNEEQKKELKL